MKFSLILLACLFSLSSYAVSPPYPVLQDGRGKILVSTGRDEKLLPLQKQLLLREKARIELSGDAQVVLMLDAKRKLLLSDEATIRLPGISWESGEAPIVQIEQGSLRWIQNEKAEYAVSLKSALFEFSPGPSDFVIRVQPQKAFAEMLVVKGQVEFQAMNAETSVTLKPNQKAHFQGVIENDEIAYDILLKGRKIPKGKLSAVEQFSAEDAEQFSEEVQRKKDELLRLKKIAEEKLANRLLPGQICRQPNAKLNECSWTCENNPKKEKKTCRLELPKVDCVRRRCNANGQWAEATLLDREQAMLHCASRTIVKKCDY